MVLQAGGMPPTTQHSVRGENFRLIGQSLINQTHYDKI